MLVPVVVTSPAMSPPVDTTENEYPSMTDAVFGIMPVGALQQSQSNPPISFMLSINDVTSIPVRGYIIPNWAIENFGLISSSFRCVSCTSEQLPFSKLSTSLAYSHDNTPKS